MSQIAGVLGLEPRLTGPEPVGLPITPYPMGTAHCEPGADFTGRRCTRPNRGSHRPRVDCAPGIRCHVDHVDTGRDVPHEGAVAAQQLLVDLDTGTSIDHRTPDLVATKVLGAETDELLAAREHAVGVVRSPRCAQLPFEVAIPDAHGDRVRDVCVVTKAQVDVVVDD